MDNPSEYMFEKTSTLPLDPRTKIFLTLTVSTILMANDVGGIMNVIRPCLAIIPFLFFLYDKRIATAIKYIVVYMILFSCEIVVLPHLRGFIGYLFISIIAVFSHMLPGGILGYYTITSTTVSEFIAAMEQMHVPQKIIIPISVVFRFFPTVKEEANSISDAMKIRGITSIQTPMKMLEYRIVPLLMSVVKIGEELSAAALTRGLGGPEKRTNICKIKFGIFDGIAIVIAFACWGGFLFL